MLGNTPLQPVDFFVERAKSFAFSVKIEHENGDPFDLTDSTVKMTLNRPRRMGGTQVLALTGQDVEIDGVRQFRLQESQLALPPAEYPYDVTLVTPQNYSVPLTKGVFVIGDNTDATTANTYNFSDPNQWVTFTIKNSATIKTMVKDAPGLGSVWVGGTPLPGGAGQLTTSMLEAIQDAVASMLVAGSNISLNYSEGSGQLTIASTGGGGGGGGGGFTGYNPIYALAYEN